MKLYIKGIITATLLSSLVFSSVYADDLAVLSVDEAIEKVIDADVSIDSLELKIPNLDEAIRKTKFGVDSSNLLLHKYKVFKDIYASDESEYDKYLEMSSSKLSEVYSDLLVKRSSITNPAVTKTTYYMDLLDKIEFIEYIYMFGNSKPELTDAKLYSDFKKNTEFSVESAEFEKEKLLSNIESIKTIISSNVSSLYKSILDIKFNMDIQRDMLIFTKDKLDVMEKNYKLGLISELDYEKEKVDYQKSLIEYENLTLLYTNLELQLKNKLRMNPRDSLVLIDDFADRFTSDTSSIAAYKENAKQSNIGIENKEIELKMAEQRFDLYKKYNDSKISTEYKDFELEVSQLKDDIKNKEYTVEINVDSALSDITSKETEIKKAKNAYEISKSVYESGLSKYTLGVISEIELSALKLDMESKGLNIKIVTRNYENAKYLFDQLINNGVTYNK